jgi:hypothetical protein
MRWGGPDNSTLRPTSSVKVAQRVSWALNKREKTEMKKSLPTKSPHPPFIKGRQGGIFEEEF